MTHVTNRADEIINKSAEGRTKNDEIKDLSKTKTIELKNSLETLERKVREIEIDAVKLNNTNEKKEQIKKIGDYSVIINLHADVQASIKVKVVSVEKIV